MTSNARILHAMAQHYAIPADSGVGRLTRTHLFYALLDNGCREARAWEWVALCDRARERHLFAAQRAQRELLAGRSCAP